MAKLFMIQEYDIVEPIWNEHAQYKVIDFTSGYYCDYYKLIEKLYVDDDYYPTEDDFYENGYVELIFKDNDSKEGNPMILRVSCEINDKYKVINYYAKFVDKIGCTRIYQLEELI